MAHFSGAELLSAPQIVRRALKVPEVSDLELNAPLLRPQEAAKLLSVRPSWIYDAVRAGQLPCLRVGRHIRFTRPMLEAWLSEHRS